MTWVIVLKNVQKNLSNPDISNWIIFKHVFRYVKHTVDCKLTFRKSPTDLRLFTFCDAKWASSLDVRWSISGYCISVSPEGPPVSWKSKKQTSVALSICEVEYMSLSFACQEVKYLSILLTVSCHRIFYQRSVRVITKGPLHWQRTLWSIQDPRI